MTLDEAITVEDAIEAIAEGCSREDYVAMHNDGFRGSAAFVYDAALNEVSTFGTARKALNAVRKVIESHRELRLGAKDSRNDRSGTDEDPEDDEATIEDVERGSC